MVASYALNTAFFLFGLLNNALYVVILTAALELLPKGVPTGVVSLANILPALIAKAVWPYVLKGTVRYTQRIWGCAALSFTGMLLIAGFSSLPLRLLGISLASFSSGLGELTFLQLSTRYGASAGDAVAWFASGTGAAGLVGAAAWWIVRPLGVTLGMAILSVLPGVMLLAYLAVLPAVSAYQALPSQTEDFDDDETPLTLQDKLALLRPMLLPYILPLVTVYFAEYTINQGVAPTLIYPLPTRGLLSLVIKRLGDYYALYQLVYQTFVFLSRSSLSIFRLPAMPKQYLWLPAVLQSALLLLLTSESMQAWFRPSIASALVVVLVCVEGLAGGAAYVSVFHNIGGDSHFGQEQEFRIGCVGFGDSLGILAASVVSMPLQLSLCKRQVQSGRPLCQQV